MLMTGDAITAQEAHRLGMVNELHRPNELMGAARRIAEKIASNSPTAVQALKRAFHPDRIEGIGAFNEARDPAFRDADY
jgi:enoyl-CoA hydratase